MKNTKNVLAMIPNLNNHYILKKKRGLITPETSIHCFMENIEIQCMEVNNAYADDIEQAPSDELITELTKLLLGITDCFKHYNVDLSEQVGKENKRHESKLVKINVL
jgi:hypothetical protein